MPQSNGVGSSFVTEQVDVTNNVCAVFVSCLLSRVETRAFEISVAL